MRTATFGWLARHELRLAWREWISLMTGNRPGRRRFVLIGGLAFIGFMHILAYAMIGRYGPMVLNPDKTSLVVVTAVAMLFWSLMLSQAMEMVTRVFYARADLDLLLSSPVSSRKVFAVRVGAIAFSTMMLAVPLAGPFINALAFTGGVRWLGAYGLIVAMAAVAAGISVGLTALLFRTIGARRTRLVTQIIAAIVGAAFVIGIQAAAILSSGTLARVAILYSDTLLSASPVDASVAWWPARAIMGEFSILMATLGWSLVFLATVLVIFSSRFAEHATAAAGVSATAVKRRVRARPFRPATASQLLRRKEWTLLLRDPWLISQSLMQILYLLPPALLLWRSYGDDTGALAVLVPIFVMAAGQLAGGLAWLAVSGEDAPDLVATAPVPQRKILRAKIEAVSGCIALVLAPLVIALAASSPLYALVCVLGVGLASASATLIQLWFRKQAKRSHFRRRQTSSRIATFAEAFSSISWASAAGLAATGAWAAVVAAAIAVAYSEPLAPSARASRRPFTVAPPWSTILHARTKGGRMADVRAMCAIGKRGQLGLNGVLPWEGNKEPEFVADVARFFDVTRGHVIAAGPKTAGSIPDFARRDRTVFAIRSGMRPEDVLARFPDRVVFIGGGPPVWAVYAPFIRHWDITRLPYDGDADRWFDPAWLVSG